MIARCGSFLMYNRNKLADEFGQKKPCKSLIGVFDPFDGPLGECTDEVPPVEASDLVCKQALSLSNNSRPISN